MVLLSGEAQAEARLGLFGDSDNLDARWAHGLCRTYHRLKKSFWTHPMVLLGEEARMEAHFWRLEMTLILTRDGCTVGTERTIGSKNHFGRTQWNS